MGFELGVRVKITDVKAHESGTRCGDGAVEKKFRRGDITVGCVGLTGVVNEISANGEADAVRVFFVRSIVGANS